MFAGSKLIAQCNGHRKMTPPDYFLISLLFAVQICLCEICLINECMIHSREEVFIVQGKGKTLL